MDGNRLDEDKNCRNMRENRKGKANDAGKVGFYIDRAAGRYYLLNIHYAL